MERAPIQEASILTEDYSLIITGLVAAVVLWFVFTLVRKLFGVVLLFALTAGAWLLWNNPPLLWEAADAVANVFGQGI